MNIRMWKYIDLAIHQVRVVNVCVSIVVHIHIKYNLLILTQERFLS